MKLLKMPECASTEQMYRLDGLVLTACRNADGSLLGVHIAVELRERPGGGLALLKEAFYSAVEWAEVVNGVSAKPSPENLAALTAAFLGATATPVKSARKARNA